MTEDKDRLTQGIAEAVRDIAAKRETMSRWEAEYSKKRRRTGILLTVAASAACLALVVAIRVTIGGGHQTPPPAFRSGLSYDAVLEKIDSLISVGETRQAADSIVAVRQEITEDTLRRFPGAHGKREKEAIAYERLLVNDVLTRLDELENKLTDNE